MGRSSIKTFLIKKLDQFRKEEDGGEAPKTQLYLSNFEVFRPVFD